jgi:hypothetical protein
MLMLQTGDEPAARALATKLRSSGAEVALIASTSRRLTCRRHPPQLLGRHCSRCGDDICAHCRLDAGGRRRCAVCAAIERRQQRNRRLRTLFSVFLFVVFLYGVSRFLRDERAHLDFDQGVDVAVFQFGEGADADHPIVRALNEVDGDFGLARISDWYADEYARYGYARTRPVRVHLFGPWSEEVTPPKLTEDDESWWQLAWSATRYTRYWHELARTHGADPDAWDVRMYVVYGREAGDLAADSRGSNKGRIAVTFVSLEDPNAAYAQLTLAHELGHVLGADDLYDPDTYLASLPRGLAEPLLHPAYPQRYAELMAVDRPLTPDREVEVRSLDEVRVGYQTAASFGWITQERADYYYRPAPVIEFGPPVAPPEPVPEPTEPAALPGSPVESPATGSDEPAPATDAGAP